MLTSPHLLKIWGPGLVLLFITTYIIILGIHIAGPSNSPSSQCLDILHSTHLSFHAAVTTSKQSPLHGSPLCLASTSALSCSLILVLPFLPFSHLTGIWNSWSFPLFIVHHGPHVFTLPLAWLRVHSTTHLPKSFVNTLNLLAPLWLHYIYWGGKRSITIHISSAFTRTLKQLNQELANYSPWTKGGPRPVFIVLLEYRHNHSLTYYLFLFSHHHGRVNSVTETVWFTEPEMLYYLSLYRRNCLMLCQTSNSQ